MQLNYANVFMNDAGRSCRRLSGMQPKPTWCRVGRAADDSTLTGSGYMSVSARPSRVKPLTLTLKTGPRPLPIPALALPPTLTQKPMEE